MRPPMGHRTSPPASLSTMSCVDVLVPVALDQTYSYRVPGDLELSAGDIVSVPLGVRSATGVVWKDHVAINPRLHNRLRDIEEKLDLPPLKPELRHTLLVGNAASHLAFAASANNDPLVTLQALALRATVLANSPSSLFLSATAHDKLHHTKQATDLYKQFLSVANGQFPDEEWEARHRLITLEHMK